MARIEFQNDLFCPNNESCFRVDREDSVKVAINRFFKVDDKYILSNLKESCRGFGLEWNFVTVLVVEYLILILVSGNHHLLRVVVV